MLFLLAVLVLHLGLLTRGGWGADEFRTIGLYHQYGPSFLWFRFWTWSPRPLSEALIWLYAWCVLALHRQLLVPALAVCWGWFLAAAWPALIRCSRETLVWRSLGTLGVLAVILLGRQVARVFYWPFGAVAYVPVVAAALVLLFVLANENIRRKPDNAAVGLVLAAAAWSSEAGAMLVLVQAGLTMLVALWRGPMRSGIRMLLFYWLFPAAAALLVLALLVHDQRLGNAMPPEGNPALFHHTLASLGAAVRRFLPEAVASNAATFDARHLLLGGTAKLLFCIGVQACWASFDPAVRRTRSWLPVLALALAVTSFGMLVSSYRQFGDLCCEQHAFVRQSLDTVALAALAIWLPPAAAMLRWRPILAPASLVLGVGLLLAPRAAEMWQDYRDFAEPALARSLTWASGSSPGPAMTFYQPVPGRLFPIMIPDGCHATPDAWWADGIVTFFGKKSLCVVEGTGAAAN